MADTHQLILRINGEKHEIHCESHETILDAALREGVDAPYSCMSGTCNSCQATKKQGEVVMEFCDALTQQEMDSGEILTCQAKAASPLVEVEWPE